MSIVDDIVKQIVEDCRQHCTTIVDREVLTLDYIEGSSDELLIEATDAVEAKLQDHNIEVID